MEYLISFNVFYIQVAFAPWVWVLYVIFGLLVGIWIPKIAKIKGNKIAVLGMTGAGKTQMLANMRGVKYDEYKATLDPEGYESFSLQLGDRKVKITSGKDIGGGEEFAKMYYENMIKENEIIFFLFDANQFLKDETYRNDTEARLEFIYEQTKETEKETVIFATFVDKLKSDPCQRILKYVGSKEYAQLFKKNFFRLDMRKKDKLMNDLNQIFKK